MFDRKRRGGFEKGDPVAGNYSDRHSNEYNQKGQQKIETVVRKIKEDQLGDSTPSNKRQIYNNIVVVYNDRVF